MPNTTYQLSYQIYRTSPTSRMPRPPAGPRDDRKVVLLGDMVLALDLTEGVALDWGPFIWAKPRACLPPRVA